MDHPTETARSIAEREFPGTEILDVSAAAEGGGAVYHVDCSDRSVTVTLCPDPADERRCVLEPRVLRLLRRETSLPVPEPLAVGRSRGSTPVAYHVTRTVEGTNLRRRYGSLPERVREDLLVRAGRYLGELHARIGFDDAGPLRAADEGRPVAVEPAGPWPAFLRDLMDGWLSTLAGGRFGDLVPTFEAVAADCATHVDAGIDPALLHFDYRPANVVVRGGDIAAILDWELARSGHGEYDLFKFEKNFLLASVETPAVRDDLREFVYRGYRTRRGLDPGWERRRAYYRVAYKLESMASFPRWTRDLSDGERDGMATTLREELETDLRRLRAERW